MSEARLPTKTVLTELIQAKLSKMDEPNRELIRELLKTQQAVVSVMSEWVDEASYAMNFRFGKLHDLGTRECAADNKRELLIKLMNDLPTEDAIISRYLLKVADDE